MAKINEEKIKKLEEQMKKNQTQDHVKVCPECGSENIGIEAESLTPNDYCQDCGFNSIKQDTIKTLSFPTKSKGDKK